MKIGAQKQINFFIESCNDFVQNVAKNNWLVSWG